MLRVATLSFWHVHADEYTNHVNNHVDCEIVAVWDELPERGRLKAEKLQVPYYSDLNELLHNPDIDAVLVVAPSNLHPQVIIAAAQAGKHIFTEKVLAISTRECDDILAAVDEAGVKLMVSLPRLTETPFLYAKQVVDEGLLGHITLVRSRFAHNGALPNAQSSQGWLPAHFYDKEQCGGGAMIDLGCHPMYLAYHYLGMPSAVTARYGFFTERSVEDNAVAVLSYDSGALAIIETGFVSSHSPNTLEIYGTEGSLLIDDTIRLRTNKAGEGSNGEWTTPETLPDPLRKPIVQWIEQILYGKQPEIDIEYARALTQLMEASNHSAEKGVSIKLEP